MVPNNTHYTVLSPVGEQADKRPPLVAPRIKDLNGKTVCQVSNGMFHADDVFAAFAELAKNRFPGIKIIPWTEFPVASVMGDMEQIGSDLREALVQRGCDAVISSTGG